MTSTPTITAMSTQLEAGVAACSVAAGAADVAADEGVVVTGAVVGAAGVVTDG
jgi:hypothetical protein